jgi:hypothetical protein
MTSRLEGAAGQFGAAYDRRAADYAAAIEPTFRPVHRRIVELAQIGPGMRDSIHPAMQFRPRSSGTCRDGPMRSDKS